MSACEASPASKYEIVSQTPLGTGKFSVVFKARRVSDGAPVALKRMQIFDVLDSADRAQLEHEATLLQRLAHPNIIRCYDTYIDKAALELVIVLELAEYDMKTLIAECAGVPMDESLIFHFFVQVSTGVFSIFFFFFFSHKQHYSNPSSIHTTLPRCALLCSTCTNGAFFTAT
jgi:serine/threonine protein kinase